MCQEKENQLIKQKVRKAGSTYTAAGMKMFLLNYVMYFCIFVNLCNSNISSL